MILIQNYNFICCNEKLRWKSQNKKIWQFSYINRCQYGVAQLYQRISDKNKFALLICEVGNNKRQTSTNLYSNNPTWKL